MTRIVQFPAVPRLSCILCSRNDAYMGNSRWRLETSLNYLGEQAAALGLGPADLEVLVTDWGSEVPLHEAVSLTPAAHRLTRFLHVPPETARARQGASPFPEVLALNAAARRASGDFIGRIDQDTLTGRRFLSWCFGGTPDPRTLYFANRRDLPYRFAAASPSLATVTRFVEAHGAAMPVHRQNPFTGHLYWTSAVGIWLASRAIWEEAGGYDERLIFYNWMETDMIHRLRTRYPIADLGAATDWDFYHLEHYHPLRAWAARPHALKNPDLDLSAPVSDVRPAGAGWGLPHDPITIAAPSREPETAPPDPAGYVIARLRVAAWHALDRAAIGALATRERVTARAARALTAARGRPVTAWPGVVWRLWSGRTAARAARLAGWTRPRRLASAVLGAAGLLRPARRVRVMVRAWADPSARRQEASERRAFQRFAEVHGHCWPAAVQPPDKRALVISSRCPSVEAELATLTAVRHAGFDVTVLLEDEHRALEPFYRLAGAAQVRRWSEFLPAGRYDAAARDRLSGAASLDDVMRLTHEGVRCGRIAACTTLRDLQVGAVDLGAPADRAAVTRRLAASLAAVEQATAVLHAVEPHLVMTDHEYTPKGELFETALGRGLDVVAYDSAHRADALVFKRYHTDNRDRHLTTLGAGTWARLRQMPWSRDADARVDAEIAACYARGDWYLAGHTPSRTEPGDLRHFLNIPRNRPVAAVFPHVLWDAPVLWGEPIFPSYQDWFVRTMQVAYANARVTWLVKLHPSHVWRDAIGDEPEEVRVLRAALGPLPDHVRLIPADTPVTTRSLLTIVDYCITVRGTVGVEAARLGIPVLTAGHARYTHHGFTIDSATTGEYLDRLRHLEDTPALPDDARALAQRFAYGAFLLRPWRMTSVVPGRDGVTVQVGDRNGWTHASDIRSLSEWLTSTREDYLAEPMPS